MHNRLLLALSLSFLSADVGVAFAQDGGKVIIGRTSDADRYDPHRSSALAAAEILYMIGDTLVTLDYDLQTIKPALAKSWDVSDDGLTYTFDLRDDVTYCNGKAFTAQDVVGSMERWLTPDGPYVSAWKAGQVESVTADGEHTVVYKLKEPSSGLLYQMAQFNFVIIDPDQAKELGEDFGVTAFNGTGPFCFESWQPRDQVVLKRHEGYAWGAEHLPTQGPAKVSEIVWKIVPEEATLTAAIGSGEIDASYSVAAWSLPQLESNPDIKLLRPDASFRTHYIGMKITRPNMQDRAVRLAVSHAIDQTAIAEGIFMGTSEAANSYYSPKALDYSPETDTSLFEYDPAKAEAVLTEAGWTKGGDGIFAKDGQKLSLVLYGFTTAASRQSAEAIQSDLRKVGIELAVELFDNTAIWGKLREQTYDLYQMDYPYLNAGDALNLYFLSESVPSPNRMMWQSEETDALIAAGNKAKNDAERAKAFQDAGQILHEAVLWKPLIDENLVVVAGSRLKEFKPAGISGAGFGNGLMLELE